MNAGDTTMERNSPPPAEPIDPFIPTISNSNKQPTQSFKIKLGTLPKSENIITEAKEGKRTPSTEINQLDAITKDLLEDAKKIHNPEKKKKKKKKKKKERNVNQQLEKRSPQKAPRIPNIDYEKLAAAQTICSDITHPKYKKPFDYGWRRELVFRATVQDNQKLGDVYYYTPNGFRLRSMVELAQVELEKGLTLDNFSFFPEPTGVNNLWKETIRAAVFRDKETVAQTRQNVRDRMRGVKRKLAANQPRKKMKRRRSSINYHERENSDFDENMADEMLLLLRGFGHNRDPRIVMDYDDNSQEVAPRAITFRRQIEVIKKEKNDSEENLNGNRLSETQQNEKLDEHSLHLTENEMLTIEPPNLVIKQENNNSQSLERSNYHETSKLPETTDNALVPVVNEWADIVVKQEKEDPTLEPCVQDDASNEKLELIISNVQTQFDEYVGENGSLNRPTSSKVVEEVTDETQHKENLGSSEENRTVATNDRAVQTMDGTPSMHEKDMLIDRLQMEILFLKEKLAHLEKSINSRRESEVHGSSSKNMTSEKLDADSDCEVICVDVMNIEYETVDLDDSD